MRYLIIVILAFCFSETRCQSQEDIAFQKVKIFLSAKRPYYVSHYNKFAHALDMGDYIIDLGDVHLEYTFRDSANYISFSCVRDENIKPKDEIDIFVFNHSKFGCSVFNKECIRTSNGQPAGCVDLGFANKEDCYRLINLIAELRDAIKK